MKEYSLNKTEIDRKTPWPSGYGDGLLNHSLHESWVRIPQVSFLHFNIKKCLSLIHI